MKHLTHWVLALLAIAAVAGLSGAWTPPQEQEPPKQEKGPPGATKRIGKAKTDKLATLKRIVPTLKMTLTEAVALAEKETSGKAIAGGLEFLGGKPMFQITVFLNDELTTANVNTETRKVTIQAKRDDEGGGGGKKAKAEKEEKKEEGDTEEGDG